MRVLTFDIEEWFHILDNDSTRSEVQWAKYETRIHENCERLLGMLSDKGTRATFFCLGWIVEKFPEVIRKIADKGYEIGTHSYRHQLAYQQSPEEFRQDLARSIKTIEDLLGKKVRAYRAPGFSVGSKNAWVFDCLLELGITIDCSVFPAERAHGGFPDFGTARPSWIETRSGRLKEFPINTRDLLGKQFVFSGGGYFRLFPYLLLRSWIAHAPYVMTYFHPRDFDPNQPIIKDLSAVRRFKANYGLVSAEGKLRRLLDDFSFTDLAGAEELVDWDSAPCLTLSNHIY